MVADLEAEGVEDVVLADSRHALVETTDGVLVGSVAGLAKVTFGDGSAVVGDVDLAGASFTTRDAAGGFALVMDQTQGMVLVDLESALARPLPGDLGGSLSVSLSPDGSYLLVDEQVLTILEAESLDTMLSYERVQARGFAQASFSLDGGAVWSDENRVLVSRDHDGDDTEVFETPELVEALTPVSLDRIYFAAGGSTYRLGQPAALGTLVSGGPLTQDPGLPNGAFGLGEDLYLPNSSDGDLGRAHLAQESLDPLAELDNRFTAAIVGNRVVYTDGGPNVAQIRVLNLAGAEVTTVSVPELFESSLIDAPAGDWLAVGELLDGSAALIGVTTSDVVSLPAEPTVWAPDGSLLALRTDDVGAPLQLWSAIERRSMPTDLSGVVLAWLTD